MGVKGSWQRPDDGNYRAKYDGIDWSAKGDAGKEQSSTEAAAPEAEEKPTQPQEK